WREGTVVRSWLLDLLDRALDEDPELGELSGYPEDTGEGRWTGDDAGMLALLDGGRDEDPELAELSGYTEDTGEGRWTVDEAVRLAVPLNVITASLFTRFESRQIDSPALKAVAPRRPT